MGTLGVWITYELLDGNALRITYDAESDKATPISLTNHSYFNLNGKGNILGHILQLKANAYTEVDEYLIPTGRLLPVEGTPMNFRRPKTVGSDLNVDFLQLHLASSYDHNYVLDGNNPAARLYAPETGIIMTMETTERGVQLYSGNSITPRTGKGGTTLTARSRICLETPNFLDAIHHANFPSPILQLGVWYQSNTLYSFPSVKRNRVFKTIIPYTDYVFGMIFYFEKNALSLLS